MRPTHLVVAGVSGAGLGKLMACLDWAGHPVCGVGCPGYDPWDERQPKVLRTALIWAGACAFRAGELKAWNCWLPANLKVNVVLVEADPSAQAGRYVECQRAAALAHPKLPAIPLPANHLDGVEAAIRSGVRGNRLRAETVSAGGGSVHTVLRESLLLDPHREMRRLYTFLGRPPGFDPDAGVKALASTGRGNRAQVPK